jgi:L-xylulokinase
MTTHLLGVDGGQAATKAVLFDAAGRTIAASRVEARVSSPHPRWLERDMDEAWREAATAIMSCLRAAGVDSGSVAAVGVCGHGDGVYPVGGDGQPMRPAILASDSRAHEYAARYRVDGIAERAFPFTGSSPHAGSPAAVYAWLRDHDPKTLHEARWLLFCKDWLRLRLTGVAATDPSDAGASFASVADQAYSPDALALYELADCVDKLPPIVPAEQIAGRVTAAAAAQTGLVAGTPVVTGAHDAHAAAIGVGAVRAGAISIMLGAWSIDQAVSDEYRLDPRWHARGFLAPGSWLHTSSAASATNLDWAVGLLGPYDDHGRPDLAAAVAAGSAVPATDAPLFLPFLEASPYADAKGASFAGLRGWHTRDHLLRAVLDGVAFDHRGNLDALAQAFPYAATARLGGGGARSAPWSQLLADAITRPLDVTDTDEASARGAAALAGVGLGWYASPVEAAAATVRVARRHEPHPDRALEDRYARYRALFDARSGRATP